MDVFSKPRSAVRPTAPRLSRVLTAVRWGIAPVLALCLGIQVHAATTVWTGSSAGGVFNDDANWSGLAPGNADPSDLGIFNSATNVNGTITFNADATHFRTFVQNTSGTIEFDTGNFKWTMTSFFLTGTAVGEDNHIKLTNGQVESQIILLGNTSGQTNGDIIEITGSNASWHTTTTGGGFRVGSGGSDNSQAIISDGGTYTGDGQIIIGLVDSANGLMRVTDPGSSATVATSIQIGGGLSAQADGNRLEVLNGGEVTGGQLLMGVTEFGDNNTALVSGANSTLSILNTGRSDIGRNGSGHTLQIDTGGTVDGSAHYALGVETGSTGNQILVNGSGASLTGSGVEAIRGSLNVNGGDVTLNDFFNVNDGIFEGGNLIANDSAASIINLNSGSISTVNSDIANGSALVVGDGGGGSATYHMLQTGDGLNGTHSFANGLSLSSNAILSGSGDIIGSVSGDTGAQVDIGASPGLTNVDGDWDNTGMTINMEIDDLSSSTVAGTDYDFLGITGTFTHGGDVVIDLSEFVPSPTVPKIKLIGWGAESGNPMDTSVSFVNGGPLKVQKRSDGLFVTVPEPASLSFIGIGVAALLLRRRYS